MGDWARLILERDIPGSINALVDNAIGGENYGGKHDG
jgi:hypothetical protein